MNDLNFLTALITCLYF